MKKNVTQWTFACQFTVTLAKSIKIASRGGGGGGGYSHIWAI